MNTTKSASTKNKSTRSSSRKVVTKATPAKPQTKLDQLAAMLRRPDGATIAQISKALSWYPHSVRGAISGTLKKKQGLTIVSSREGADQRIYRIAG